MTNEDQHFCQSCGMPMEFAQYGTETDRSNSHDYYNYCYEDGKFKTDITMEEMIDFCAKSMSQSTGMSEDEAKVQMAKFFPQLKRWK